MAFPLLPVLGGITLGGILSRKQTPSERLIGTQKQYMEQLYPELISYTKEPARGLSPEEILRMYQAQREQYLRDINRILPAMRQQFGQRFEGAPSGLEESAMRQLYGGTASLLSETLRNLFLQSEMLKREDELRKQQMKMALAGTPIQLAPALAPLEAQRMQTQYGFGTMLGQLLGNLLSGRGSNITTSTTGSGTEIIPFPFA